MLYIMYTVRSHDIRLSIAVHAFQSIFLKYRSNGWSSVLKKEKYKFLGLDLQKINVLQGSTFPKIIIKIVIIQIRLINFFYISMFIHILRISMCL